MFNARLLGGLLCACASVLAPAASAQPATHTKPSRAPAQATAPFMLAEADIPGLQARIAAGELDSVALTRAYLQRIAAIDRSGPQLRSVIALNPQALREAAARDAERRAGHLRGPLHGMPVLLKDNINARPMPTTAGSLALQDFRPADAFLVTRLRAAGAVILGKTNLSEWANYRGKASVSGWSARGGQTRNPYRPTHSPCGSSSGSAVAVAANLAVVSVGTETDGSIACPAAMNGVVGLKPTVGLVSRDGIVPISSSQDSAGPLARSVTDAAILLTAMAGRDEADPATATRPGRAVYDYAARLRPEGLQGARIGVLDSSLTDQPGLRALMDDAEARLREAGATVIRVPALDERAWQADEQIVLQYEFKAGLERYLRRWEAPVRTLPAILAFNRQHAAQELALFGQELMEDAARSGSLGDLRYIDARARARRAAGEQGIDARLREHALDALVAPTTGVAWAIAAEGGDAFPGGSYGAAAVAGYPSLSVPMGHVDGLPAGLLFMGTAWSEPRLIELAYAFEQRTMARRAPPL
ncbi:amidase [Xanthomonas sp. 60]